VLGLGVIGSAGERRSQEMLPHPLQPEGGGAGHHARARSSPLQGQNTQYATLSSSAPSDQRSIATRPQHRWLNSYLTRNHPRAGKPFWDDSEIAAALHRVSEYHFTPAIRQSTHLHVRPDPPGAGGS
jgi:hypothetical protein